MKLTGKPTTTVRYMGRPPLVRGERTISMTVSVTTTQYDRWSRWALARHIDLSPLIRELLHLAEQHYSPEK